MSGESEHVRTETGGDIEREILATFDSRTDAALSTRAVASAVGIDEATAREHLGSLAADGELDRVDLEGEYVGWERPEAAFLGYREAGSYVLRDTETGLVTRDATRPDALRRLADRIEQFEAGTNVGAQLLGISEAAITPAYLDDLSVIVADYVEPSNRHLYVYLEEEGVVEITAADELQRTQTVRGYAITAVVSREEFDDVMVPDGDEVLARTPLSDDHFPLGVFKVVAVDPEFQGTGIGTALSTHAMAYLAETPPVLALLWDRGDDSNVKLAEKFDADRLATFEDSMPFDEECPECGFDEECTCDTVLYGWGLDVA